jgi:cell division septal protein FtsQ
MIVDRDLRVLHTPDSAFDALPAFVVKQLPMPHLGVTLDQPDLIALRNDEDALANAHLAISNLEHDKFGDLVVTLHNGIRVLFGDESDLAKKIPLVDPILTQVGREGRPIAAIDLRAIKTPVVEYKK